MEPLVADLDWIMVQDLRVHATLGMDGWERRKLQPVMLNLAAHVNVCAAGESDLLVDSVSYSALAKTAQKFTEGSQHQTTEALVNTLAHVLLREYPIERVRIRVDRPRTLLHAVSAGIEVERTPDDYTEELGDATLYRPTDVIFIKELRLNTIIGVNSWERREKQTVLVSLKVHPDARLRTTASLPRPYNFRTIVRTVTQATENSAYKTVEALASVIARICVERCHVPRITVLAEKPSALLFARAAAVQITRDRDAYDDLAAVPLTAASAEAALQSHRTNLVYIALGSNMGDRVRALQQSLKAMAATCDADVLDTSFLYETAPMYVEDQPMFLNAVCKIRTSLAPEELLRRLKTIEADMGRDFGAIRNGPRPLDLDILFYNNVVLETPTLIIPHPRIAEREFVLRPLCDIALHREHPTLYRTCGQLLDQLMHVDGDLQPPSAVPVIPLGTTVWQRGAHTCIMGILNVTPDSFSDGGKYSDLEHAVNAARAMVEAGANIIDVGGMSTRPGADDVPMDEEAQRAIPVIRALRASGIDCPISIDTFRAEVAKRAIEAGANIINDVSGGDLDANMFPVAAELGVPICVMHMRGTPKTMQSQAEYPAGQLIDEIVGELSERVKRAKKAGISRWNIILDPGLGFAKKAEHSFALLRRLPELTAPGGRLVGFPTLVGPSRKGFVGVATGQKNPADRTWGTAAACTAAVAGGADILRVHDITEMTQSIKVADAVWRNVKPL
ncbi:Dihydropteroate synthase-like protein [Thamnocephalis sphaerospora]|uniref:Folic acid synthesis protein FOL1 n=1 Tax=Thamnocephalis sphaerospora TaxID=78915 RepID=A0A4P9XJA7_9FUNG|nr:Dihydropteroate synthase-like protein [Thamnocephalis sphaerospora]|eukprot:RKP05818.1 Dihydropteroate synthase-like protein [Thamnocephalis sphaerospora]